MGWICTDHDFGLPYGIFGVSLRSLQIFSQRNWPGPLPLGEPAELEKLLQAFILYCKPEMVGGRIISIQLTGMLLLNVGYYHPSLPIIKSLELPDPIRLGLPLGWRERGSML